MTLNLQLFMGHVIVSTWHKSWHLFTGHAIPFFLSFFFSFIYFLICFVFSFLLILFLCSFFFLLRRFHIGIHCNLLQLVWVKGFVELTVELSRTLFQIHHLILYSYQYVHAII